MGIQATGRYFADEMASGARDAYGTLASQGIAKSKQLDQQTLDAFNESMEQLHFRMKTDVFTSEMKLTDEVLAKSREFLKPH